MFKKLVSGFVVRLFVKNENLPQSPFFGTKENGQGIGLTLVQEILDSHGFEFSLEGLSNQQTRFTIFYN
jgi:nitrogen-specific signal transduction histidine kinase